MTAPPICGERSLHGDSDPMGSWLVYATAQRHSYPQNSLNQTASAWSRGNWLSQIELNNKQYVPHRVRNDDDPQVAVA